MDTLAWVDGGRRCELRVVKKGGELMRFVGFPNKDKPTFEIFFEGIGKDMNSIAVCTNGINCGKFDFGGDKNLSFKQNEKFLFELAMDDISNCSMPGVGKAAKAECQIGFHEDENLQDDRDELVEMRVFFPNEVEEVADGEDAVITGAERFRQDVLARVNVGDWGQEQPVVEWPKTMGTFRVPNGRFQVEMFMNAMRLHGDTQDYKILYKNIQKLFLLRQPSNFFYFIISLEVPIRRGQQRYKHLIWKIKKEFNESKLNLTDEQLAGKFKGKLQKRMEMDTERLISIITMHLTDVKVHTDDSSSSSKFISQVDLPCLRCDMGNDNGYLYPLVRQFIFLPKPTTFIQYQDVDYVEFQRLDNANRLFDLLVMCKRVGNNPPIEYKFQNMDKLEYKSLRV